MTTNQTTAAGAVQAARAAPDAGPVAVLPGKPFPLGAAPGEHLGIAGMHLEAR